MLPEPIENHQHYQVIESLINHLSEHHLEQPTLSVLAKHVGLSEYHLQRVFTEWAGVSPATFLRYLTKEYAKKCLTRSSVMDAALESGLSGTSRLHDLFINCYAMTPAEYKKSGASLTIHVGVFSCLFGYCLLAVTSRGLCKLAFFSHKTEKESFIEEVRQEWPLSQILLDQALTEPFYRAIFLNRASEEKPLPLLLKGSPFRLAVWEALLSIPEATLVTYSDIAFKINKPKAVRAVASSIAANPVALLIPCHRVIRNNGDFNQYRWGSERKRAIIALEQSKLAQ